MARASIKSEAFICNKKVTVKVHHATGGGGGGGGGEER